MPKRFIAFLSLVVSVVASHAEPVDSTETINYRPNVHGTIRGRFEASTERDDHRFAVRMARIVVDGRIAPFADYFLQADLCDRGKMKILDVYARLWPVKDFAVQAGQFRMPFGVDPFRAPHQYFFNNRSFIGREVCNVRAVGFKAMWTPSTLPITLEAGAFNPNTITDHSTWHRKMSYAAKLTYKASSTVAFATGFQSLSPDSTRINLIDATATWKSGRWTAEAEYMYKHYGHDRHKPCHAYNMFANYQMPIKAGIFNRLGFHGRFDGMTNHSTGVRDSNGLLITDHSARNRITAGATISYVRSANMFVDFRVDYEKYFYRHNTPHSLDRGDQIVAELILRF